MSGNGPQPTAGYTQLQQHHQQKGQGRRRPASAAVETVLQFGYPQRLVTSTYRELCATLKASPADVQGGEAASGIKAVALLKAVEDRLQSWSVPGTAEAAFAAWHEECAREITCSDDDEECEGDGICPALTPASDSREELSHFGRKPGTDSIVKSTTDAASANSDVQNTTAAPVAAAAKESETIPSERGWCSMDATIATSQGGVPGSQLCEGGSSHETMPAEVSRIQSETVPANLTFPAATTHRASLIPAGGSSAARRDPATPSSERREAAQGRGEGEGGRHTDQLRALCAENRRLKARNTCRHCRQRPVSLTLLPCGHFCFCYECGSSFRSCPVCRKTILADVRTFVA